MILVLFRHGHSPSAFEAGVTSDKQRPLSAKGRGDVLVSAKKLFAEGINPGIILSSPYVRARETADIIASLLNQNLQQPPHPSLSLRERIKGEGAIKESGLTQALIPVILEDLPACATVESTWALLLSSTAGFTSALIVGHQPVLGALAGHLAGLFPMDIKAGGFVCLDIKNASDCGKGCASVKKIYNPE